MVQCQAVFHKCATDHTLVRVLYSKLLNYHFNAHYHLPTERAVVEFVAHCNENGYRLSISLSVPQNHSRVWMVL